MWSNPYTKGTSAYENRRPSPRRSHPGSLPPAANFTNDAQDDGGSAKVPPPRRFVSRTVSNHDPLRVVVGHLDAASEAELFSRLPDGVADMAGVDVGPPPGAHGPFRDLQHRSRLPVTLHLPRLQHGHNPQPHHFPPRRRHPPGIPGLSHTPSTNRATQQSRLNTRNAGQVCSLLPRRSPWSTRSGFARQGGEIQTAPSPQEVLSSSRGPAWPGLAERGLTGRAPDRRPCQLVALTGRQVRCRVQQAPETTAPTITIGTTGRRYMSL